MAMYGYVWLCTAVYGYEGGVKVCGNAVLRYFGGGLAEIFISTCGISVLLGYTVCGIKKVWVTVIGDRDVSAVLRFH